MAAFKASGSGPSERQLNGPQTTGRTYHNLSDPAYDMRRENNVTISVRDGTTLLADLFRPDGHGGFPALISFSPYPRQIQDLGAPLGFIEAGASDFFVPRGYAHLIVNARGTGGSGGTWGLFDEQEREDLYDLVEWAAAQPWCDGNVGMLGISYFAMAQLEAAVEKPPHLKAIAPLLTSDDLYGAAIHNGLLSSGFISAWLPAIGVMSTKSDEFWRGAFPIGLARDILNLSSIHARMQHVNGEAIISIIKGVIRAHYPEEPFGMLWRSMAVEHPTHDEFWDERNVRPLLGSVEIPVYLGADWDNVPMHLPSTFTAWKALKHNPNVRMALLPPGGFNWPWESLHYEMLAWYDHWLKGHETGIMDGPPVRYQLPGIDGWRTSDVWPPVEAKLTALTLAPDGTLSESVASSGTRQYLYLPQDSGVPTNANPPDLPASVFWETLPFQEDIELAGAFELQLDATISSCDASFIAVLYDVPENAEPEPITAGWLRASFCTVDEDGSEPGAPSLPCKQTIAVAPGQQRSYRIPLVDNARHLPAGHRLRLVLASDDEKRYPTVLGFTHVSVREASLITVSSTSRLLVPVLSPSKRDRVAQTLPLR
jgi:uncharacterized protein